MNGWHLSGIVLQRINILHSISFSTSLYEIPKLPQIVPCPVYVSTPAPKLALGVAGYQGLRRHLRIGLVLDGKPGSGGSCRSKRANSSECFLACLKRLMLWRRPKKPSIVLGLEDRGSFQATSPWHQSKTGATKGRSGT